MKPLQFLELPEAQLSTQLRQLKTKELERLADKLTPKLCTCSYQAIMTVAIKVIPKLNEADRFAALQKTLSPYFKEDIKADNDKIRRFTLLVMLVVVAKFKQIHQR